MSTSDVNSHHPNRARAVAWARDLLQRGFVVLDCETTGLDRWNDDLISLAVVDPIGTVLLNTYVKSSRPIDEESNAYAVNGITDAMLAGAPPWEHVVNLLAPLILGRTVVAYGSDFDLGFVGAMCERYEVPLPNAKVWTCALEMYSLFRGEQGRGPNGYKRHRLSDACAHMGLPIPTHAAAIDALATLGLIGAMAIERENGCDRHA